MWKCLVEKYNGNRVVHGVICSYMKIRIQVVWEATLCRWINGSRRFEGTKFHHLKGSSNNSAKTYWTSKIKTLTSSATSGTTHPKTQSHISEDLNSQQQSFGNLKQVAPRIFRLGVGVRVMADPQAIYNLCVILKIML